MEGFLNLEKEAPGSEYAEKGAFGLAEAYYGAKDPAKAKENYARYLAGYPQGTLRDQALYGLGWSTMDLKEYQASYDAFQKLLTEFPQSGLAPEASLESGEALYRTRR